MDKKRETVCSILWGIIGWFAYNKISAHFEHRRRMEETKAYVDLMRETRGSLDIDIPEEEP